MNLRKNTKRPLTPPAHPCVGKLCCAFCWKFVTKLPFIVAKFFKLIFWIGNAPPPFGSFPKIHPNLGAWAYLICASLFGSEMTPLLNNCNFYPSRNVWTTLILTWEIWPSTWGRLQILQGMEPDEWNCVSFRWPNSICRAVFRASVNFRIQLTEKKIIKWCALKEGFKKVATRVTNIDTFEESNFLIWLNCIF